MDETEMDMEMSEMVIEDNNAYLMAMGTGSRIEIHAADAEKESWTELSATADAGTSELVLADNTGWEVGDKIAITSTEIDWEQSEEFTILAISDDGQTITLDGDLEYTHRGEVLEYNNGKDPSDPDYLEWEVEVQAEVSLLSRNVTIQGDADSVEDGFGGHTMVMNGAEQHIQGAEFFQMGQSGILGRYPMHFHLLGDDGEGQYIENVSVHASYQKGITIHGTNNVRVEDTVIYDHFGHGIFFEDGTETGNLILGNLVFDTKVASDGEGSIPTDETKVSSFWIENPDNVFIGNHAAGSEAHGYWIFQPDGTSVSDIIFQDNVAHSTAIHSLGISGFIQSNLNFRESQFDADYAVIKDFTAWESGSSVWAHSTNVIYDGLELYDADLFTMGENTFLDMLIVNEDRLDQIDIHPAAQGAITFYRREGGNEIDGLHLEGFEGVQIDTVGSDLLQQPHVIVNFTDDLDSILPHIDQTRANTGNGHKFLDIDGSLTGFVGGVLVPNGNSDTEWLQVPIGTEYQGVPLESFISETNIGTLTISDGDDDSSEITISRNDGLSGVLDDNDLGSVIHQPVADTQDYAFLIEFPEDKTDLNFALRDLREGDSAIYEVANVASVGGITGAVEVSSFDEMVRLDQSSYILTGDTLVLRLVGGEPVVDPERAIEDPAQDYRAEAIVDITGIVQPNNPTAYGDAAFTADLLSAIEEQPDRAEHGETEVGEASLPRTDEGFELDPYESTSDTTVVTDSMARWSEGSTWGDADAPGADDIVVIGPGETVVLDASTTVKGIIVNGGELIIEDGDDLTIDLATDYLLVINGGLFQAGTETDLLDTDFTLTLEGDDPDFDLEVTEILMGNVENTIFAETPEPSEEPVEEPVDEPVEEPVEEPVAQATGIQVDTVSVEQPDSDTWFTVEFDSPIEDAVVIMGPVEDEGGNPAMTRVRNVTETGFEFQIDEWDYLDGYHIEAAVTWMAASAGDYEMSDGRRVSFGSTTAEDEDIASVTLNGFDDGPIVVTQVGGAGADAVTTRVSDVTSDGFDVRLQEEEAADGMHVAETVYWMAVEEGEGELSAFEFTGVDHNMTDLEVELPAHILADMQTFNGNNTAALRYGETADGTLSLQVQEEQSADSETWHIAETIGAIHTDESFITLAMA